MDILQKIIEQKKTRLAESKRAVPLAPQRARAIQVRSSSEPHRLLSALSNTRQINVIAEIKRASPSKGVIREDVDAVTVARAYHSGGAAAISILTEEDHFRGSLEDFKAVRRTVPLPLLRKDFIFDEYQVYESAAAGADALLLIVAALGDRALRDLRKLAEDELKIDALVEVHSGEEMKRAIECRARLIGVNNRDLRSFEVSLETSVELATCANEGMTLISESGIDAADDIRRLRALGYKGFLIGETLMRAEAPDTFLRDLIRSAGSI
jgi:indole-3-glycerol phosphate synthase